MRMAYLIMAHDNRVALEELLEALLPSGSPDFALVHVDRGSALWGELGAHGLKAPKQARLLPDPVRVRWGHWSIVAALHLLIEAALREPFDYAHSLSGLDWPVASRDRLAADLAAAAPGTCFAEAIAQVQEERMQGFRFDARRQQVGADEGWPARALAWELRRLSEHAKRAADFFGIERSRPLGPWHKGSCWWTLPRGAVEQCRADLAHLIETGRLAGTSCADEHAVQTSLACRGAPLEPNRRFIEFPEGSASPRFLTAADLPAIHASGAWFMRKVDAQVDPFFRSLP